MHTYNFTASTSSVSSNGTTTAAAGTGVVVGGFSGTAGPNASPAQTHMLLTFDTHTIAATELIVATQLSVVKTANGAGTVPDIVAWGSNYLVPATPATADWNIAANNGVTGYRFQINTAARPLLPSGSSVGYNGLTVIPSRLISQGTVPSNGAANIELRPLYPEGTGTVSGLSTLTNITVSGTANVFNGQSIVFVSGSGNATGTGTITAVGDGALTVSGLAGSAPVSGDGFTTNSGTTATATVAGPTNATSGYPPVLTVVTLLPTEMDSSANPYRYQAVGAQSYFAFGIEPSEGTMVKGSVILDADSIGLTQQAQDIFGNALSNQRARPRKVAIGRTGAGGSITAELTPEKCFQLFPGFLKITQILDVDNALLATNGVINGSGTTNGTPTLTNIPTSTLVNTFVNDIINFTTGSGNATGTGVVTAISSTGVLTVSGLGGSAPAAADGFVTSAVSGSGTTNGTPTLTNIPTSALVNTVAGASIVFLSGTATGTGTITAVSPLGVLTVTGLGGSAPASSVNFVTINPIDMNIIGGSIPANCSLGAGAPYTYTWKVAQSQEVFSFTGVVKKGAFRKLYPGLKINSFSLNTGLDQAVRFTVDFAGLDEYTYDQTTIGVNDEFVLSSTAAYDTIAHGIWSFVDASVSFGGQISDFDQSMNMDFTNDLRERRGLNGQRGPTSHFPLGFTVRAGMNLYFQNELHLRTFLGTDFNTFPFKPGKTLNFEQVNYTLARKDINTILQVLLPKASFQTLSDPIQGEDVIMLNGELLALFDDGTNQSNVVVTLITNEPPANFEAQTQLVTIYPPGVNPVQSLSSFTNLPVQPTQPPNTGAFAGVPVLGLAGPQL
jgi:hypothetical protein